MEAISVKNLSVAYENNTIIEDLSLSIPKGKISIIIGANGCGKSTFLKTLIKRLPRSTAFASESFSTSS